jgi:Thoeris protein ThsA, Macro domain
VIDSVFNGDTQRFRKAVDAALANFAGTHTPRTIEPKFKYEIGTTAVVENGPHKIFLVAMSHVHLQTAKASSTVPMLWHALRGALTSVTNFGNGAPLSLPLIGNGRSSVNIEPQHLLRLIVLALVDFGRKNSLPKNVSVIVPEGCFEMLDIREIKRDWKTR